jgi:phytoene dehydrogenase-like protein
LAERYDAIVIGSGPNGLAAAIVIARTGRRVVVLEAEAAVGGGVRSAELTLPGFVHDVCSAMHPLAAGSPIFRELPLDQHGLAWIAPAVMLAHPLDSGRCGSIVRSIDETASGFGEDGGPYLRLMRPVVDGWPRLESSVLAPPLAIPAHPIALARFGLTALRSADGVAGRFATDEARAIFGGIAAHGMRPLDAPLTASFALVLGAMAHVTGWVMPRGGAQRLADALASYFRSLGGEIATGSRVASIDDLPPARAVLCDLSPQPFLRIAGHRLPPAYRRKLERYRYGMGVFKVDWALDAPIPWQAEACRRAGTVHLGGRLEEIDASEADAWAGRPAERPFTLVTQPTLFDASRAPAGRHTAWAYCHVPSGSDVDMLPRIEQQIERFAPGFRDRILATSVMRPADLERHNANLVGGDIGAGVTDLRQFIARPTLSTYSVRVLGIDAARRRRPRDVRLSRRAPRLTRSPARLIRNQKSAIRNGSRRIPRSVPPPSTHRPRRTPDRRMRSGHRAC